MHLLIDSNPRRAALLLVGLALLGCPAAPPEPAPDPSTGPEAPDTAAVEVSETPDPGAALDTASPCPNGPLTISPAAPTTTDPLSAVAPNSPPPLFVAWRRQHPDGDPEALATGSTLPSYLTQKGDQIEAIATSPLHAECPPLRAEVVIGNTAPTLTAVIATPSAAYVDQPLTCAWPSGAWLDPDAADPEIATWAWLRGEVLMAGETTAHLSAGYAKGDSVRCQVTPSDGEASGPPVFSAPVIILNSPPTVDTISLPCPAAGEPFHCTASGTDPDQDPVTFTFSWHQGAGGCGTAPAIEADPQAVSGALGGTLKNLPVKGSAVFCCATPLDGDGQTGAAVRTDPCLVPNAPPLVTGAVVSAQGGASPIVAGSTLTCAADVQDPDGDIVESACKWLVDGAAPASSDGGCTLAGAFVAGQSVCCQVHAFDGSAEAVSGSKTCVQIADSPPVITGLGLTPQDGDHCAPIGCLATASDPDGDATTVLYAWSSGGVDVSGPQDAVPGQTLTCAATPVAAGVVGQAVEAELTLKNHPPSLSGVSVLPNEPSAGTALTCVPGGFEDADLCDTPHNTIVWYVDGQPLGDLDADTLPGSKVVAGSTILCLVTPGDGWSTGSAVQSKVVTIPNTPPAVLSVHVSPPVGGQSTPFACEAEGADADADPIVWAYTWSVDGTPLPGFNDATATGVPFDHSGALLRCTAQPSDALSVGPQIGSDNAAVLVNAPPKIAAVAIEPEQPNTLDALLCTASATDPDGDETSLSYAWIRATPAGPEVLPGQSGPVLPASATAHFDALSCQVTPHDGLSDGTSKSSPTVVVANTPPSLASVSLTPPGGTPQTEFACAANGYVDIDADPATLEVAWTVDGQVFQGPATLVPAEHGGGVGTALSCQITPSDGFATGAPVSSNPVVLSACAPGQASGPCDDGNACTDSDTCQSNACVGVAIACDDQNPCTQDGCEPAVGCVFVPNQAACDDADPCTESDACQGGLCVGQALPCDDQNPCTEDVCSPVAGCLSFPNVLPCDDQDPCTVGDVCSAGACTPGAPKSCDDNDPCTDDTCDGGCHHTLNTAPCDDNNPCTTPDLCVGGACLSAGLQDCDDGNACTADGCSPLSGCTSAPLPKGAPCQDGDVCTSADGCDDGQCVGGPPTSCDDQNPCTQDSCQSGIGCMHVPQAGTCAGGACFDGGCCQPTCGDKVCGDNGCGGSCGGCGPYLACLDPPGECSGALTEGMTVVPSGDFWMGCNASLDADCKGDEYPYHDVTLAPFEIDTAELSVAQFRECVTQGACAAPGFLPSGCLYDQDSALFHPINCIDFFQATAACAFYAKRLCTEAEWEKAARGADGRVFPWGQEAATCALAVINEGPQSGCGLNGPWPIGAQTAGASPYGALNMAGNIGEWVHDWYYDKYYQSSPVETPPGPGFGIYRVYRGGDFESQAPGVRTSRRDFLQPDNLSPAVGVRCCKDFP